MRSETLDSLAAEIRATDSTVALTGAGVSTASGIPSFRGEDGLWDEFDPMAFHRRRLDADPSGFWQDRLELRERMGRKSYDPNAAHDALASMAAQQSLDAVVTQNVDGLHGDAGSDRVVKLHGTRRQVRCDDCGHREPADPVFARAADGACPPHCDCGGVFRPAVVLFGESLSDEVMNEATRLARESDVFLALGSSLSVRPASLLPQIAVDSGARLAIVNFEQTPRDSVAEYVLRADVTDVLPAVLDRL